MTTEKAEHVALFRFGLIFPLLDERIEYGQKEKMINEICSKSYEIPYTTRTVVSRSALLSWVRAYKERRNIDDLMPRRRSDCGKSKAISGEFAAGLVDLKKRHPDAKLTTLIRIARDEGLIGRAEEVPMSSVYRFFSEIEVVADGKEKDRKRFEMESCNDMWMLDAMSGPKVWIDGEDGSRKTVTAKCFGLIDDKSRYIVHAEFYSNEKAESLMDCMWKAMNKCGLPRKILTDNGSAMRDERVAMGLAGLEVQLSYCKPYQPQGKAKIERFWRTVREQFLITIPQDGSLGIGDLNRRFKTFIDKYNNRYHSSIGMSPNERFSSDVFAVRVAPMDLPSHFKRKVERKVSYARTVQIEGKLFQVPLGYMGKKVELRYMDLESKIEVWFSGEMVGTAEPVDLVLNGNGIRKKEENDG